MSPTTSSGSLSAALLGSTLLLAILLAFTSHKSGGAGKEGRKGAPAAVSGKSRIVPFTDSETTESIRQLPLRSEPSSLFETAASTSSERIDGIDADIEGKNHAHGKTTHANREEEEEKEEVERSGVMATPGRWGRRSYEGGRHLKGVASSSTQSSATAQASNQIQTQSPTATQTPIPIQTHFVPLPEDDVVFAFDGISPANVSTDSVHSIIAVAVPVPGTVLWYDHWEDGFEWDITNPTQVTTLVLGDEDWSNGCVEMIRKRMSNPPVWNYACSSSDADTMRMHEVLHFVNANAIPTPRNSADIFFDGGDLIKSSFPVTMSRVARSATEGYGLVGAVEVFDSSRYGTHFVTPFGTDSGDAFSLAELYVMASEDGTVISYDGRVRAYIDRGETYIQTNALQGLVLKSNKEVQVTLITGKRESINREMRWFALLPFDQWSSSYHSPVSSDSSAKTAVWVHNPLGNGDVKMNIDSIVNTMHDITVGDGSANMTLGHTAYITTDASTGTHIYTSGGERFYAISVTDQDGQTTAGGYDWGFPLLPDEMIASKVVIGWAPGCAGNVCDQVKSRSVVFVTALADKTTVHIDYNGDGTSDEPHSLDQALQQLYIWSWFDQDMSIAVVTATSSITGEKAKIAVAWGQMPSRTTGPNDPYAMDTGTAILPVPYLFAGAIVANEDPHLHTDSNYHLSAVSGDTLKVTVKLANTDYGTVNARHIKIVDDSTVLGSAEYVSNSMVYTNLNGEMMRISDNGAPSTPFPLDEDGLLIPYNLNQDTAHQVTFLVKVKDTPSLTSDRVQVRGRIASYTTGEVMARYSASFDIHFNQTLQLVVSAYPGRDGGASCPAAYTAAVAGTGGKNLTVPEGSDVTFCYVVTNTGNTYFDHSIIGALEDSFGSDWISTGGPTRTAPGDQTTLVVEVTSIGGQAITNNVTVRGQATLFNGYDLSSAPVVAGPDIVQVEVISYEIQNLIHCERFEHTTNQTIQMTNFEFIAHSIGCVNVRVFVNDRTLTQDEMDKMILAGDWSVLCHANVQGMGSSVNATTNIPPESCTPMVVEAGRTLHFYIAVEDRSQDVCDQAPATSGIDYAELVTKETDGATVCAAV